MLKREKQKSSARQVACVCVWRILWLLNSVAQPATCDASKLHSSARRGSRGGGRGARQLVLCAQQHQQQQQHQKTKVTRDRVQTKQNEAMNQSNTPAAHHCSSLSSPLPPRVACTMACNVWLVASVAGRQTERKKTHREIKVYPWTKSIT